MQLSYDFPADTSVLEKIGKLVTQIGQKAGFNDVEISDLQLVLIEVCTNAIVHGLKNDSGKNFQVIFDWETGKIEIYVHEAGEPFDPLSLEDPNIAVPLDKRQSSGYGLYFLHKLMDEADFQIGKDGVKTWRILKRKKIEESRDPL